jgi:hypothetical protein
MRKQTMPLLDVEKQLILDLKSFEKLNPLYCGMTVDEVQYQEEQNNKIEKFLDYDFQRESIASMVASLYRGTVNP